MREKSGRWLSGSDKARIAPERCAQCAVFRARLESCVYGATTMPADRQQFSPDGCLCRTGRRGKQFRRATPLLIPNWSRWRNLAVATLAKMCAAILDAASRIRCYPSNTAAAPCRLLLLPFERCCRCAGPRCRVGCVREGREPSPHAVHSSAGRFFRLHSRHSHSVVAPTLRARRFTVVPMVPVVPVGLGRIEALRIVALMLARIERMKTNLHLCLRSGVKQ